MIARKRIKEETRYSSYFWEKQDTTGRERSTGINAVRRRHDTRRVGCADGRDWKSVRYGCSISRTHTCLFIGTDTLRVTAVRHAYDGSLSSKLNSSQSQRIIWPRTCSFSILYSLRTTVQCSLVNRQGKGIISGCIILRAIALIIKRITRGR